MSVYSDGPFNIDSDDIWPNANPYWPALAEQRSDVVWYQGKLGVGTQSIGHLMDGARIMKDYKGRPSGTSRTYKGIIAPDDAISCCLMAYKHQFKNSLQEPQLSG